MSNAVLDSGTAGDTPVRASGLGKYYRASPLRGGKSAALRDCDFELPAGKVAALVGANGAGKTTLLSILAGLLTPEEGTVRVAGRSAFVSQDKAVYRHLPPADMLRLAARLNRTWDEAKARGWLERFDVPLDRPCGKLSGGQRAQVAFAAAVGSRPDVLLLDEPLANLDPLVRREVMSDLLSEAAEAGMTVVLSTHVVAELGGVADHLLLLAHGRLLASGDLDDLLAAHVLYTGPRAEYPPGPGEVIEARHRGEQSSFLARVDGQAWPSVTAPWSVRQVNLEEFVLAHLAATRKGVRQ